MDTALAVIRTLLLSLYVTGIIVLFAIGTDRTASVAAVLTGMTPLIVRLLWPSRGAAAATFAPAEHALALRVPRDVRWTPGAGWNLAALVRAPRAVAALDRQLRAIAADSACLSVELADGRLALSARPWHRAPDLWARATARSAALEAATWSFDSDPITLACDRIRARTTPADERVSLFDALVAEHPDHRATSQLMHELALDPEPRLARAAAHLRGDARAVERLDAARRRQAGGLALSAGGGEVALAEDVTPGPPGRA